MEDRESRLDKSTINDRYEDLRREAMRPCAMESGRSQGFGVFSLQGMIGWLQAWSRCTIPVPSEKEKSEDCIQQNLPIDLHGQVAILLANMAINVWQEV
jgi:hypothetical protein